MSDCTHSPEILAALAQLRDKHPQWGWCVSGRSVIQGELRDDEVICAVYQVTAGGWHATVTVWREADWEDGEGAAADVVRAFECARRAARVEVVR
jgi:hypothetical protein